MNPYGKGFYIWTLYLIWCKNIELMSIKTHEKVKSFASRINSPMFQKQKALCISFRVKNNFFLKCFSMFQLILAELHYIKRILFMWIYYSSLLLSCFQSAAMKKDQCLATCFEWAGERAVIIICITKTHSLTTKVTMNIKDNNTL